MGQIRKKKGIGIIEDEPDRPLIRYCPSCLEAGFYSLLGPKIIMKGEPVPTDYDKWLQCLGCGRVFPIYEGKIESKLHDFVETSTDPFDNGKKVVGLGNKKKSNRREKEREKLLERIDEEKEEDIKEALRKGNIVEIIEY